MKLADIKGQECRPHIEYSVGNLKVGKDTIIMNVTSAKDCMSLARNWESSGIPRNQWPVWAQRGENLCQVPVGTCYAWRSETFRKITEPYRNRQTVIWDALTPEQIAEDVKRVASGNRKIPIKYLRMQESGDFRNQADVRKMSRLADLLRGVVKVYTYTARRDLDYSNHSSNLIINGSNFMVGNNFKVVGELSPGPKCHGIAGGGCFNCMFCKTGGKKVIQELLRGSTAGRKELIARDLAGDEHGGVPSRETITQVAPSDPNRTSTPKARYSVGNKSKSKNNSKNRGADFGLGGIR